MISYLHCKNVIAKQDLETLDLYSHELVRFFAFSHRPSVTSLTKASVHRGAVAFTLTLEAARPAGDARTQFFSHLCPHPVPLVLKKWPWPWWKWKVDPLSFIAKDFGHILAAFEGVLGYFQSSSYAIMDVSARLRCPVSAISV